MRALFNESQIRRLVANIKSRAQRGGYYGTWAYLQDITSLLSLKRIAKEHLSDVYKEIEDILKVISSKINQYTTKTAFITENTLTQTTYYKTLTSHP